MYDNGDILLYVLSAWRQISWHNFKQCFDEIQRKSVETVGYDAMQTAYSHRWRALRDLSTLGHIDVRFERKSIRVAVAPPVLAALPSFGNPKAVLCGARSPSFIEGLRVASVNANVELTIDSQSDASPYAPARVEIQADKAVHIKFVADSIGIHYLDTPPARLLAHASISLSDYCLGLAWSSEPEIDWDRKDFDTCRLQFRPPSRTLSLQRLSRYQHPSSPLRHYRLWQGYQSAEIDLDWGRYAILALTAQSVLWYLPNRIVLVPYELPLPTLLARAVGLCSGHCPTLTEGVEWNLEGCYQVFSSVPPSIFNKIAGKVDQATLRTGETNGCYSCI